MRRTASEQMRELRLRKGLNTQQMAKALGYKGQPGSLETIIKRFEGGRRRIPEPIKRLITLMDAYDDIPPGWYNGA